MSNTLAKINSCMPAFSKAEKLVADYVRRHIEKAPFLSVYEVARTAGVSVASVSRMARKLGYPNFKEFKIGLARETPPPISTIYRAITPDDSGRTVTRKVFAGNIQSLQDTLKILDIETFVRAARAMSKAERIVFVGIGSSGYVALDAALRFMHLDIQAEACMDSYQMLVRAMQAGKKQVVVGISHSGRSTATVQALALARDNGATTIGISNYVKSPLRNVSRIFFCTAFRERSVKAAALSSAVAQMCLIDALYVLMARQGRVTPKVERVNAMIEQHCRMPANKR
ncbi:MAG: MurR/RpiR family transcriptional regulator [Verrucomicrobia bacterium]|nr:MurR/RpiR family transcriptional regulator [Verrucomicrobiota bacterium]